MSTDETTVLVRGETIGAPEPKSPPKDSPAQDSPAQDSPPKDAAAGGHEATVLVRGETTSAAQPASAPKNATPAPDDKAKPKPKPLSEAKVKMQSRLPALDDDADIGTQKEQMVTRDGKADLTFTGTLIASAAPPSAPQGQWQEYRIYETNAGKHVFSKVGRNVIAEQPDTHQAEVFDPSPSSVPSKLLRTAHDLTHSLTHSHPMRWTDAAVAFFGYDPLAKTLYRKLSGEFEEHVS